MPETKLSPAAPDSLAGTIRDYLRAGFPLLYLQSHEELRVELAIARAAREIGQQVFKWSCTKGWFQSVGDVDTPIAEKKDPREALEWIKGSGHKESVFVLRDYHQFVGTSFQVVRTLRDILPRLSASGQAVVILSPVLVIPPELEKEVTVVKCDLPDREDLDLMLTGVVESAGGEDVAQVSDRIALLDAARGLTLSESQNVFSLAIVKHQTFNNDAILTVMKEAAQTVKRTGILEFIEPLDTMDQVGGLNDLKAYLATRSRAFSAEARDFKLPVPRGVMLLGIPGTGKSLTAKAIAKTWNRRLLRLDMGRLFGGIVGESERNTRMALAIAEAISPCVLWIDELADGFAGSGASGVTDSGTTRRVTGTILTWMAEKKSPVYLVATTNDIEGLPPQLLRKGRWDEIFFVDLPTQTEKTEILAIHLTKLERDPKLFDLSRLAMLADQFSGSELEEAVISGMWLAFDAREQVTTAHIERAIKATKPLAVTSKTTVDTLRKWAKDHARFATSVIQEENQPTRRIAVDPKKRT